MSYGRNTFRQIVKQQPSTGTTVAPGEYCVYVLGIGVALLLSSVLPPLLELSPILRIGSCTQRQFPSGVNQPSACRQLLTSKELEYYTRALNERTFDKNVGSGPS